MSTSQKTPMVDKMAYSPADSRVIDLLALACVRGLGDGGIAHVLAQVRRDGGNLGEFFLAPPKRLHEFYGLREAAAKSLRKQSAQFRKHAVELLSRIPELGIELLVPGEPSYPRRLDDFYEGEPPLLYACGNLQLLDTPCAAILNSASPTAQSLEFTLGMASRLAEAGRTLLAGAENPSYNLVAMACKRASGHAIIVIHHGLLTAIGGAPHRHPLPPPPT